MFFRFFFAPKSLLVFSELGKGKTKIGIGFPIIGIEKTKIGIVFPMCHVIFRRYRPACPKRLAGISVCGLAWFLQMRSSK